MSSLTGRNRKKPYILDSAASRFSKILHFILTFNPLPGVVKSEKSCRLFRFSPLSRQQLDAHQTNQDSKRAKWKSTRAAGNFGMAGQPNRSQRIRAGMAALIALNSLAVLSDKSASMTIGDAFTCVSRPVPLSEVRPPKGNWRLGVLRSTQFGQINP